VFPCGENSVELGFERRPMAAGASIEEMSRAFMASCPEAPIGWGNEVLRAHLGSLGG